MNYAQGLRAFFITDDNFARYCAYKMAWQRYYTIDHVEKVMRRVAVTKANAL